METLTQTGLITVPRSALQALAEWAYPTFASDRIRAKLPPAHPRWVSWNSHDDLQQELEQERMAFLKQVFWRAEQEASRRERALDASREFGCTPSLELFMECVAEMDDHHWDEPLAPKEVAEWEKKIRAKQEEEARLERRMEQKKEPTPENLAGAVRAMAAFVLESMEWGLQAESDLVRTAAKHETEALMVELGTLLASSQATA